jgi:hypothetical protein
MLRLAHSPIHLFSATHRDLVLIDAGFCDRGFQTRVRF